MGMIFNGHKTEMKKFDSNYDFLKFNRQAQTVATLKMLSRHITDF